MICFLQGYGCRKIKKYLEDHGIKTVTGKRQWNTSTIDRILSNEKYIGRNVTPKTYTPDFLTGKQKENQRQIDMIIIEDSHQAIISQGVFDDVQNLKGNIKNKEVNIRVICF